jgi:hypothetical protein
VKASIEEKIKAEQEAQKMEFVLQKAKQEAETVNVWKRRVLQTINVS